MPPPDRRPFDLSRLRRAVAATGKTVPMTPDDLKAYDVPKRGAKIRLPARLGGGTARYVGWRPDGDLYIIAVHGLRKPIHVAAVDITDPLPAKRRRRWLTRKR